MNKILVTALAIGISFIGSLATAQPQMIPARLRGTIDTVGNQSINLTTRQGDKVTLALDLTTSFSEVSVIASNQIKPGSFVGVTAVPGEGGTLTAIEVHVFPESQRGTGEGHRPWDLMPQSTMTNGTVGEVTGTDSRIITVKYKEGAQKIFIPAQIPVVTMHKGARDLLKPGAHVIVFALKASDGTLTAARIVVGKDGLVPPM